MRRILRLVTSAATSWRTFQTRSAWLLAVVATLWTSSLTAQADSTPFIPTGSLTTARTGHTATLLPNGQVLVAGGWDGFSVTFSSAEVFDSTMGAWTTTGPMANARLGHTATMLPNGKVLVAGGQDIGRATWSSAELYDSSAGTWTDTGSMTTTRAGHTATMLPNGQVLVAGGIGGDPSSAELYDPATETWTDTGSMTAARYAFHTATLLPNGQVLVAGGEGIDSNHQLASAELYDPATGTWTATRSMGGARYSATATLMTNGEVLVAGGVGSASSEAHLSSAELYDPTAGTWTATGSLINPIANHTATLLPNGRVLVAPGWNGLCQCATAELYDSTTGTWAATGALPTSQQYRPTATLLTNGWVLLAGGAGRNSFSTSTAELYEFGLLPTVITLASAANMPGGAFQFAFTNIVGARFSVLATTNLSLALSNWTVLGPPNESPAGHFQFSDPQVTNNVQRFYRVRSP